MSQLILQLLQLRSLPGIEQLHNLFLLLLSKVGNEMKFGYLFRFFFMEICQHDTQDKTTHTSKMISVILLPIKQS